jgi:predicted ATPase/transcriptional regulator with XRE-family HTH domain
MDEDLTFGGWVKRRRRAIDITQRDLADRVGCAVGTVRRLESDDLRPSRQVAERLADTLAIPSDARESFIAFARDLRQAAPFALPPEVSRSPAVQAHSFARSHLPQPPTTLLGRSHTISALTAMLLRFDVRLITLTGPPGVGKTRLGLQVAAEVAGHFADGVVFVPLASLGSADLVPVAIAQALGLRDDGRPLDAALIERLVDRETLLLIDNMEHVVAAAPLLAQLLAVVPRLTLLVTSRVSLRLAGEHAFAVAPLALPDATDTGLAALAQNPAVALFCMRARAVQADFVLDAANAPLVATICHRLEGLPLAIELAAMRSKLFTPQALIDRLDTRLPLLRGGPRDAPLRQQTVEAAIAWSYDLLSADQQRLFMALATFAGGWTLSMAEALGDADLQAPATRWQIVDDLAALVDHSLVRREPEPDREPRFTMLEIIREYALARQMEQGVSDDLRAQHARLILALARAGASGLWGSDQPGWLTRLDREIDNIRHALDWSTTAGGDLELGLALAGTLWWFWWVSGRTAEGRRWLDALLAQTGRRTVARAEAQTGSAALAFFAGDFASALPACARAMAETQAFGLTPLFAYAQLLQGSIALLNDDAAGANVVAASVATLRTTGADGAWFLGTALIVQTIVAMQIGDLAAARRAGEEGLAVFQRLGQPYGIASAQNYLGDVVRLQGDWNAAGAAYAASLPMMRASGVRSDLPALLHNQAYVALHTGDVAHARDLFTESLALQRRVGNRAGVAESLYGLAAVAAVNQQPQRAARFFGAAGAVAETSAMPAWSAEAAERARYLALAQSQVNEEVWADIFAIGARLPLDRILIEAMSEET